MKRAGKTQLKKKRELKERAPGGRKQKNKNKKGARTEEYHVEVWAPL